MFNIDELRHHIEALICDNPELADDEILRADMLDGETNITDVLSELARCATDSKLLAEAIAARQAELEARKTRIKNRVQFFRNLILKVMQSADLKKMELPEATLSQRAGQPQITGDLSTDNLPLDLCKVTVEPDRVKIRAALLAHRDLPGIQLSNAPPTLAINTR